MLLLILKISDLLYLRLCKDYGKKNDDEKVYVKEKLKVFLFFLKYSENIKELGNWIGFLFKCKIWEKI